MDRQYQDNIISLGNRWVSYANADFLKNVICWIADNGEVDKMLKTDLTKKRQQAVINLCKDIKTKLCW